MVFPGARLFRALFSLVPFGRCGGTRETGNTVAESLVVLYRVGRKAARSSTSQGGLNACARESKARTGRFLREKLIFDFGLFSSYEGHKERRTGNIRGSFSRVHRALDGWMLARAPALPTQGLHHHGSRCFNFPYFCTICGLEKPGLADQNWLERNLSALLLSTLVVGRRQQSESIDRGCSRCGVRKFDEPLTLIGTITFRVA